MKEIIRPLSGSKTEGSRDMVAKECEAIRFSDTVSSDELRDEERVISDGLASLKELLNDDSDK